MAQLDHHLVTNVCAGTADWVPKNRSVQFDSSSDRTTPRRVNSEAYTLSTSIKGSESANALLNGRTRLSVIQRRRAKPMLPFSVRLP